MNTLKDNPMDHHCAVLRSDDNYQSDVEKSRFQSHVLQVLKKTLSLLNFAQKGSEVNVLQFLGIRMRSGHEYTVYLHY